MKTNSIQVSMKQDSRQMDKEAAIARKAYKTICRRAGERCIKTLHHSNLVVVGIGEYEHLVFNPFQLRCLDGHGYLYADKKLKIQNDIASFLVNSAKFGDVVSSKGKILVHENESLESLAVEFDLES